MISGCGVVVLEAEISPPPDRLLSDGDLVEFGQGKLEVIHTPGHTRGGISLYSADEGLVFTGDTLFAGLCGRTDLAGGSQEEIVQSLRKLTRLPASKAVYTGHGPQTTIAREKESNPYVSIL
jgi:hydroxyacylglutathione hydrolase